MTTRMPRLPGILIVVGAALILTCVGGSQAVAAQPPAGLGTATSFAVLAGSTVTNTNPSIISGDLGVSPGTAVTGFPPGVVTNGTIHSADAVAAQAQADLTTAYNDAAGRLPPTAVTADLGGQTLVPGVYAGTTLGLTGALTLDAQNDPNAVFVFQTASTLITASASSVVLVRGTNPCNVFWQVGSSATLGTNSGFVGSILALTTISAGTGATVVGRLLARNGAVNLDTNTVTRPLCTVVPPATTTTTAPATTTTTAPATTTTTAPATTTTLVPATTAPATTTTTQGTSTTTGGARPGSSSLSDGAADGSNQGAGTIASQTQAGNDRSSASQTARTATALARTGGQSAVGTLAGLVLISVGAGLLAASRRATAS